MNRRLLFMLPMLLISMLSSLSALAYDVEIDGIYYNITSKTKQAEVTSGDNKYSGDIVIPSSIMVGDVEYTVTEIGKEAFATCENLLSVSMPNSIITIRTGAFHGCLNLVSIIIPNSVTTIEGNAFVKCSKIRSVSIPNSVQKIGGNAFSSCKSLSSISIPNSITEIEGYMFYNCN
ncbi:MAG: leucine-rich repeat domain-containing protein [Prevotella sp.]